MASPITGLVTCGTYLWVMLPHKQHSYNPRTEDDLKGNIQYAASVVPQAAERRASTSKAKPLPALLYMGSAGKVTLLAAYWNETGGP